MAAPWSMKIMILSFPVVGGLDRRDGVDAEDEFFLDQSSAEFLRFFGGPGGDVTTMCCSISETSGQRTNFNK
jgi:hypothetical protein